MVAADILTKVRLLLAEPNTTRWTDAALLGFINDGQTQLALEIDFPEDTYQIITQPGYGEYQFIECLKVLEVYVQGGDGSKQPLIPTDKPTLAGENYGVFDQNSGLYPGYPARSPQWIAQQAEAYPILTPLTGGSYPATLPYTNTVNGQQRPEYYMRGGFLGIVPKPVSQYTVFVECIPQPPAMNSKQDICTFPVICKDYIAYKACEYAMLSDKNSLADDYAARAAREIVRPQSGLRAWLDRIQAKKPKGLVPTTRRSYFRGAWEIY